MDNVQALLFDIFGTTVDWRKTVTEYLILSISTTLSSSVVSLPSVVRTQASTFDAQSWAAFAQEWRNSYYNFTRSYDPAEHEGKFVSIDHFHEQSLKDLLQKWGLNGLWDDDQVKEVSQIWHRLAPWPDTVQGLSFLSKHYRLAMLSNGNTSLLRDLVAFGSLPFNDVISAEDFGMYKPRREVYEGAAKKLGLDIGQCAMVAAHLGDLQAAKKAGMKTIYVERRDEEAWDDVDVQKAKKAGWVDIWVPLGKDHGKPDDVGGFIDAARRLGIQP